MRKLICRLFGHRPPGTFDEGPNARVYSAGDGERGFKHLLLLTICRRCHEEYRLASTVLPPALAEEIRAAGYRAGQTNAIDTRIGELREQVESWKRNARDAGEEFDGALVTLAKLYTGCGPGHELWQPWDTRYVRNALRASGTTDYLAEAFERVTRGPYPAPEETTMKPVSVSIPPGMTPDETDALLRDIEGALRPVRPEEVDVSFTFGRVKDIVSSLGKPGQDRSNCQAVQHSDQVRCEPCGLVWDVGDPFPPECGRHEEDKS